MKITKFINTSLLTALFVLTFSCITALAQDLSSKRIIRIKEANGHSAEVLDQTLWVRLKPGVSHSSFCSANPNLKLTPLLKKPNKFAEILQAPNAIDSKIERMYVLEYSSDLPLDKFILKLKRENSNIESVEPYYVYEFFGSPQQPNDPKYNSQVSLDLINAKEAFKRGLVGSPDIVIGISDSGCDIEQEDLVGQLAINTAETPNNGIDDDNNGYIDDYAGYNFGYQKENTKPDYVMNSAVPHGMIVASILASKADNGTGIVGTGNQCKYFPLKISENGRIIYGYQSIMYAAARKFKVLNCSWGRVNKNPYSQFEQDIIDYAISQGVAIVAASGNRGYDVQVDDVYFPANYRGVLGVGATDLSKNTSNSYTTLSIQTDILAPGPNLSSEGEAFYAISSAATSFATPVISGFVGLIRAKYPELSPMEALEFARVCSDDVSSIPPQGHRFFLPRFVNFLKALDVPPSKAISIRPISIKFIDENGNELERLSKGQGKVRIKILLRNYFASVENIDLKLSYRGYDKGIRLKKYKGSIDKIEAKSDYEFSDFEFMVDEDQPDFSAFRVELSKDDNVFDSFTFPAYFNVDFTTFSNSAMSLSVSDYGKFGYSMSAIYPNYTAGFEVKGMQNILGRNSGITLTINNTEVYTAGTNYFANFSRDFKPIKTLTGKDKNISILSLHSDEGKLPPHDLSIIAKYTFPIDTLPIVRIDFELINNGDKFSESEEIVKPALGMLFDWDMPNRSEENISSYFAKGVLEGANLLRTAAQITSNLEETHNVGMLVWSEESNTIAQSAGVPYSKFGNEKERLIPLFTNGVKEQGDATDDYLNTSGIKFNKTLKKGDKVTMSMLIAYSDNRNNLAKILKNAFAKSSVDSTPEVKLFPNPASDYVILQSESEFDADIEIINLNGETVLLLPKQYAKTVRIDISALSAGSYFILCGDNFIGSLVKSNK